MNAEEEAEFSREPIETAGGEISSVGATFLLVMVNCRLTFKQFASQATSAISSSDVTEEQLIRKQNIVSISSSDMTGGAAKKYIYI